MKKFLFILFCLVITINCSIYANTYTFNFNLSDFSILSTTEDTYITTTNEQFTYEENSNEPALPVTYVSILIPHGKTIQNVSYQCYSLDTIAGIVSLASNPIAEPTPTNDINALRTATNYPDSIYPQDNVQYIRTEKFDAYNYAIIRICPFIYNVYSSVIFIQQLQIALTFQDESAANYTHIRKARQNINEIIENPQDLISYPSTVSSNTLSGDSVDYLIITSSSLQSAFSPLAQWKTIKGVKTKIITTEDIYNDYNEATNTLKIKQCIYDYYQNYGIKYVALGGDNTIVPTCGCYGKAGSYVDAQIPCDMFYACFGGRFDWDANQNDTIGELTDSVSLIQSVSISRIPIRSSSEASDYVQKVLRYEQKPHTGSYVNRFLLAGVELWNTYSNGLSDAQLKSQMFDSTFIIPYWNGDVYDFFDTDTDFGGSSYDVTPQHINDILSNGYHFVHYASHGSVNGYETETTTYSQSFALQLSNSDALSVVTTMACHTNRFDNSVDPCFSEALIRNASGGAICYLGSSRYGWGYSNTSLPVSLGPSFQYNGNFFKTLFSRHIYHFAQIVAVAKSDLRNSSTTYNSYRWLQFSLNPMGDAEIPIYTDEPTTFENISITRTGSSLLIDTNGTDSCTITVSSADFGETYYAKVTDTSSASFSNVPEEYYVVVCKHNYIPYIYSNPLYIQNETFTTDTIISGQKIVAGRNVTPIKPIGDVTIAPTGRLTLSASERVILSDGVKDELGGRLIINQ